jgi:hypothetical protein
MPTEGEIDRIVELALAGDAGSLAKALQLLRERIELDHRPAPFLEPASLRKMYEPVEAGILACARREIRNDGRLFVPRADTRALLAEIAREATCAWLSAQPRVGSRDLQNGASLAEIVEAQAERYVKAAIDHLIRRGA